MTAKKKGRKLTAKLTEQEVAKIRNLYWDTNTTQDKLGRRFGVVGSTISDVISNVTWKPIEDGTNDQS